MADFIDKILDQISVLIQERRFLELETEALEIKPVPPTGAKWKEISKSACAFLNTRGGIILLGIKESGKGEDRRYEHSGYDQNAEPRLKQLYADFRDQNGQPLSIYPTIPRMEIREALGGRIAIIYIEELPADLKYAFFEGAAYRRELTGDHRIKEADLDRQNEYKEEAWHIRELQPIEGLTTESLDLDRLNEYIIQLNQPVKIQSILPTLVDARSFLERKGFVQRGGESVTTLGALVCAKHPEDSLGFRCQAHCYVDVPQEIARDKQDLVDNILPLMERSVGYVLRNTHVGVSPVDGGARTLQYPEDVIRETVNNALVHRDYSINSQTILSIRPDRSITVQNPGRFRPHLLIDQPDLEPPIRRIVPEAKARNPRLADVLRVFRKWEGKGIGMATLVNRCLDNEIDLPTYRLRTEDVKLTIPAGRLLGDHMKIHLDSFEGYVADKNDGFPLSEAQRLVLAYLIKGEWASEQEEYTILLGPDNNHFDAIKELVKTGLILKHHYSVSNIAIYYPDPVLVRREYRAELIEIFGSGLWGLDQESLSILNFSYRYDRFCRSGSLSAKSAALMSWFHQMGNRQDIREFDTFYRKIRSRFNRLEKMNMLIRQKEKKAGYRLNTDYEPTLPSDQ